VTASIKVAYAFSEASSVDVKVEAYRQSSGLRFGGGSPYLDPFRASFVQFGVTHKF
jgi:hypothetical protein